MSEFLRVRNEVDPEGMFLGAWHRRILLPSKDELPAFSLEEKEVLRRERRTGGVDWIGEQARWYDGGIDVFEKNDSESGESFDLMAEAEAEASVLLESVRVGSLDVDPEQRIRDQLPNNLAQPFGKDFRKNFDGCMF